MRLSGFGWVHSMNSHVRLCLCLVLVCLITVGAAACPDGKPSIKFKADPMVLNDGDSALYTFVVKNATEVVVIEAGDIIKQITNPSAATLKGTVQGNTTYSIRKGGSNTFTATLIARNESGEAEKTLTLSFATEAETSSLIPPVSMSARPRSPQWGEQYLSPPSTKPSPPTKPQYEPNFFECPSGCPYCLTPGEAANLGFTQRCSEELCYYSPDKEQKWYCYSEPEGWCCRDTQVSQATRTECTKMGGDWYASQAEAIQACQPTGWCCRDGNLYEATQAQCAQTGGAYWSANQAEAMKVCQEMATCWCCVDGKIGQVPQSQCLQMGGHCYNTQAEAARACQQTTTCWCCVGGKIGQVPQSQCLQMGGACYNTQAEAARACQQTTTCWCCAGGKVFQAPQSQCLQMGGACYATQAGAARACQQTPPTQGGK
jgi:hypothetical protein